MILVKDGKPVINSGKIVISSSSPVLTNTWVLKDSIILPTDKTAFDTEINFTSDNESFVKIGLESNRFFNYLGMDTLIENIIWGQTSSAQNIDLYSDGWLNTTAGTDVVITVYNYGYSPDAFRTWLNANGTKLV